MSPTCLSVCLFVCLSIAHRSQFQTDHHEIFSGCRGCLNWAACWFWGQRSSWGQISKIVIFFPHPIDLRIKEQLHREFLNWETNYFWDQKVKGQLKVKLLKSSIFKWKIVNLHPINLKVEQDLHSPSLNWESNYFEVKRSKVNSRSNF